jgi:hypothetical protein
MPDEQGREKQQAADQPKETPAPANLVFLNKAHQVDEGMNQQER